MDNKEFFLFDEFLDYVFIGFFKMDGVFKREAKLQQVSFNLQQTFSLPFLNFWKCLDNSICFIDFIRFRELFVGYFNWDDN